MLHASYLTSENRFGKWFRDGAKQVERTAVLDSLTSMYADLSSALAAFENELEDLSIVADLRRDRRSVDMRRKELDVEVLHCQFLAGWTNYFLAILRPEDQVELLKRSDECFREFLQLDRSTPLVDLDARWFDFSSAWHIRAMAGLAAIAVCQQQPRNANHLYSLIGSNADTRDVRESVVRFRVIALGYAGRFQQLLDVLSPEQIQSLSRQSKMRLYVSTAEVSRVEDVPETIARKLDQIVLVGLTREMAAELLETQVASVNLKLGESFESSWILGYRQFCKLNAGDASALQLANEALTEAVSLANVNGIQSYSSVPSDVARCKFLLAWVKLKRGDVEIAIDMFSDVAEVLASVDAAVASESAWMAAKTAARVGLRDSTQVNRAWDRLERFVRRWPESPHVAEASFEKLKFELRSMRPDEAIQRLREIPIDSEVYVTSLLESVTQHYRLWQDDPSNETFEQLEQACNRVQLESRSTAEQQVRSCFLVLDALSRSPSPDDPTVTRYIDNCKRLMEQVSDTRLMTIELLYYRMQLADRQGEIDSVISLARSIVVSGRESRFETPALIRLAKDHEQRLLSGETVDEAAKQEAIQDYQRLSQLLGDDRETLQSSGNARVAFARLGEWQIQSARTGESERIFQRLVDLFPQQRQVPEESCHFDDGEWPNGHCKADLEEAGGWKRGRKRTVV